MAKMESLPRWAQAHIKAIEERLHVLQAKLDAGVLGPDFPLDNLHLLSEGGGHVFAPSRYRGGRFLLGNEWDSFVDMKLDTRSDDRGPVRTVAITAGFSRLHVLPEAGNSIRVAISR